MRLSHNFLTSQICLNAIRENIILKKISEFTLGQLLDKFRLFELMLYVPQSTIFQSCRDNFLSFCLELADKVGQVNPKHT